MSHQNSRVFDFRQVFKSERQLRTWNFRRSPGAGYIGKQSRPFPPESSGLYGIEQVAFAMTLLFDFFVECGTGADWVCFGIDGVVLFARAEVSPIFLLVFSQMLDELIQLRLVGIKLVSKSFGDLSRQFHWTFWGGIFFPVIVFHLAGFRFWLFMLFVGCRFVNLFQT